jgi:hypothetical protein
LPAQLTWLLLEGLLPLVGAAVLYLIWGGFRYICAMEKAQFSYHWAEAADPLGWLYGGVIIASQSAKRCFSAPSEHDILGWSCVIGGVVSLLLLTAAMTDRGAASTWKPTSFLRNSSLGLTALILLAGYLAHTP